MNPHFRNYRWKGGLPVGIGYHENQDGISFKIVMDPYKKRISIEKYEDRKFKALIYDSAMLNFRRLNPSEQMAWEKEVIEELDEKVVCLLRNQEDRIILVEHYFFKEGICKECHGYSPHGNLIMIQRMYYQFLGDAFNGVILFDSNEHPVVLKKYAMNEKQFADVIEEQWDMHSEGVELENMY